MKIRITADSTCDLSPELVKKFGVGILPLTVVMGENSYKDGVDITPQDIFKYVSKSGVLPKTSAPSVEEYAEFFALQLKDVDTVIHYNISSKASASHENAAAYFENIFRFGNVYAAHLNRARARKNKSVQKPRHRGFSASVMTDDRQKLPAPYL